MFEEVEDSASPRAEATLGAVSSPNSATPSSRAPSPERMSATALCLPEVLPFDGDSVAHDDDGDEREDRPLREALGSANDSTIAPTQADSLSPLASTAALEFASSDRVEEDERLLGAKSTIEFVFRHYESLPPILRSVLVSATLISGLIVPCFRIRATEPLGVFLLSLCLAFAVLTTAFLAWQRSAVVAAALDDADESGARRTATSSHCPPQCRVPPRDRPSSQNPLSGRTATTVRVPPDSHRTVSASANRRDVVETDRTAIVESICQRNGCNKWHFVSQLDVFIAIFGLLDCCLCAFQYPAFASCNTRILGRYLNGTAEDPRADIHSSSVNPCVSYVPTVSLFSQIGFCILLAPRLAASLSFVGVTFVFLFVPRVFVGSAAPDETSQLLVQLGLQVITSASIAFVSYRGHVRYERLFVQSISVDVALYEARSQTVELQELLESLFPHGNVLDRILKQKPVLDTVECGAVGYFEARDFLHWTTTLMPADVVNTLGYLYSLFDLAARAASVQIVKAVGDRYTVCCGLLASANEKPAAAGVRHPVESVTAFAVSQLQLLAEVNFKLRTVARPMAAAVLVHFGPLAGTMLGSCRAMSYELVGPTVDLAEQYLQKLADNRVSITMPAAAILVSVSRKYRVDTGPSVSVSASAQPRTLRQNSGSLTSPGASTGSNTATWNARAASCAATSVDIGHVVLIAGVSSSSSTTAGTFAMPPGESDSTVPLPLPQVLGGSVAVQSLTSFSFHHDEPQSTSQSTPTVLQQELRYQQIASAALQKAKSGKLTSSARGGSSAAEVGDDMHPGSYGCGIAHLVNTPPFDPRPHRDDSQSFDRVSRVEDGDTSAPSPIAVGERALRSFVARINPAAARAISTLQYAKSHYSAVSAILRQLPFLSSLSVLVSPYEDPRVYELYQHWRVTRRRNTLLSMAMLCLYTVVDQGFMMVDMLFVSQRLPTGRVLPPPFSWEDVLRCSGFYVGLVSVFLCATGTLMSYVCRARRTSGSLAPDSELRSSTETEMPSRDVSLNSLRGTSDQLASTLRCHRCELALVAVVQTLTFVSLALYPRRLVNNGPVFVGLQMFVVLLLCTVSFVEMMVLVLHLAAVFLFCHLAILTDDGERRWILVVIYVACAFFVAASRERLEKLRFDLISLHEGIAECHDQERALRQTFFDVLLPPCLLSRKATTHIRRQRLVAHGHMEAIDSRKKRSIAELLQLNVVPPLRLHFHDLFVLLVRFDIPLSRNMSLEDTVSWQQECVQLVDDVVYQTSTSPLASFGSPQDSSVPPAARMYMLGNLLVYAGPTVPSARPPRMPLAGGGGDRHERQVADAAEVLLMAAHGLVRSRLPLGGVLSSILCCGSSFATVLGSQGLTASLVGMVAREGVGLMSAAPRGFHGVSARAQARMEQLATTFAAKELVHSLGPPQRWRIRGCGTTSVRPIVVDAAAPTFLPSGTNSREALSSDNVGTPSSLAVLR